MKKSIYAALLSLGIFLIATALQKSYKPVNEDYTEWNEYLGGPDRNHYSALDQIKPENVRNLKVAWTYATLRPTSPKSKKREHHCSRFLKSFYRQLLRTKPYSIRFSIPTR